MRQERRKIIENFEADTEKIEYPEYEQVDGTSVLDEGDGRRLKQLKNMGEKELEGLDGEEVEDFIKELRYNISCLEDLEKEAENLSLSSRIQRVRKNFDGILGRMVEKANSE